MFEAIPPTYAHIYMDHESSPPTYAHIYMDHESEFPVRIRYPEGSHMSTYVHYAW